MFENILHQSKTINQLKQSLSANQLAPSMLFWGNNYQGKLTTALELGRLVNCTKDQTWNCSCQNCEMSRRLIHPHTVLLGSRYFELEIEKCSALFLADTTQKAHYYLYLRSLNKLLRRFDPFLWEEDDNRFKKSKAPITELRELIPQLTFPSDRFQELVPEINAKILPLADLLAGYTISIGQVRALVHWIRNNSQAKKVIILEEADKMQEGARNALLKILEEPPLNLIFILIANNINSVMPTILSRVRPYQFVQRSKEQEQEVLKRIFKTHQFATLKTFLNSAQTEQSLALAKIFMANYDEKKPLYTNINSKQLDDNFITFLEDLAEIMAEKVMLSRITIFEAEQWLQKLSHAKQQYEIFHQSTATLMEYLFYQ